MLKSPDCKRLQGAGGGLVDAHRYLFFNPSNCREKEKGDTKTLDKTFTIVYNKCIK